MDLKPWGFAAAVVAPAVMAALVTCATAQDSAGGMLVPCLDTDTDRVHSMKIRAAGPVERPLQRVFGKLTTWTPATRIVGFRSALSAETENIEIKAIEFNPRVDEVSPAAQMALPVRVSIGKISRTFEAQEVKVNDGILMFPGCRSEREGNQIAFKGSVTFENTSVVIDGEVVELKPPKGSSPGGNTTGVKQN